MTSDDKVELQGLGQVALSVKEIGRATAFYRDVLGLSFLFDAPGMAFFDVGGVRLMLTEPETEAEPPAGSILYYRVGDLEGAHASLEARGVTFEGAPHVVHRTDEYELWMAFFRDSEGNLGALMSEAAGS